MRLLRTLILLVATVVGVGDCVYILVRWIRSSLKIRMGKDDPAIKGTVCELVTKPWSDFIIPVVEYSVDGVKRQYRFRNAFPFGTYEVGREVELSLSEKSGLAYDRRDIMKELWTYIIFLIVFVLGFLMLFFNVVNTIE